MREYISNNLSDDYISPELNLIIKRFIEQLNSELTKNDTKSTPTKTICIELNEIKILLNKE